MYINIKHLAVVPGGPGIILKMEGMSLYSSLCETISTLYVQILMQI